MPTHYPAIEFDGLPLASGIAIGKTFSFKQIDLDATKRLIFRVEDIDAELLRLDGAVRRSREQLVSLQREMGGRKKTEAAQIFCTQSLLLEDEHFLLHVKNAIAADRLNAEHVLAHHIELVKSQFHSMQSEVFRIKSLDVQDVFFRLLRNLLEIEHVRASSLRQIDNRVILVADKFLPSDIVLLEKEKLLGIVLEEGSAVSHVAIIAKSIGVPAIINVAGVAALIGSMTHMIADGFTGKVIVNPTPAQLSLYKRRKRAQSVHAPASSPPRTCATSDGRRVTLQANAGCAEDIEEAIRSGAEGIGLVRSELWYLSRAKAPSVDEEYAFYKGLIDACKGRPLTIRLLDIGADKSPPYLPMPSEDCPQLGTRGIRYLLQAPDLFKRHLLSVLRASQIAPIKILLPFVSLPREIEQTKTLIATVCAQENIDAGALSVGAMIEVPAAAFAIATFADMVDFFSIGTNDLVQYLFAASRENGNLEEFRRASLPLVLSIVRTVVACAERHNKPVSVCGEIASQPTLAPLLVGAGADYPFAPPGTAAGRTRENLRRLVRGSPKSRLGFTPGFWIHHFPADQHPQEIHRMKNSTLLIVDDDPNIFQLLNVNLENAGYRILKAIDGEEAVTIATAEAPDLIILDIMMPKIDGYQVCRKLRENESTYLIPIIVLSAKDRPADKIKGLKLGADDYLTKPFDIDELIARIDSRLQRTEQFLSANPLTGLPGNVSIMYEVIQRLRHGGLFSFMYLDVDNFKPFNDKYGFPRGDAVIKFVADILVRCAQRGDFIGHIGGDDFVMVSGFDLAEAKCQEIIDRFDSGIAAFYDQEDRQEGGILSTDRHGTALRFPVMTVSIGLLTNERNDITEYGKVIEVVTELKQLAKATPHHGKSLFVKERRK